MFNPDKINERIDRVSMEFIRRSPLDSRGNAVFKPGFRLQYHTVDQVAQANSHIDSLLGEGGVLVRPYNMEEIRWIRNERALCRIDFRYWSSRYGFIIDYFSQLVRFNPNIAQSMALDIFSLLEGQEIAVLMQFLKARQLGVTTLVELVILWRAMFYPRTNALVASSDPDKSRIMAEKMELCFENQPFWLVPKITSYRRGELIEFKNQNSAISIQHGTQMSGLARGSTPSIFHLSEVCDYRNPEELIDASLIRAVHDNPWTFGILESTAARRHDWWHNKWLFNVENWPRKRSRICPAFLPWYVGTDINPTIGWLRARPVPENWVPQDLTLAHAERAKAYVHGGDNPLLEKFLGDKWEMPREQMWFWEVTRGEYAATKILHKFYQELCADDKEAFQSSNISIFDAEVLDNFRQAAKMPVGVYGIQAPQSEIPILLQAREGDIDTRFPPIDIRCKWAPMQPAHEYRLVPLIHRGPSPFDPFGKIILYEFPEKDEFYGLGTDTGFGLGQDRSCIQVMRKGSLTRNDAQIGEYTSPYVNSFNLWPFNLALGTFFSVPINGQIRQAKQVIEMAANGENVQNELKKRGWRNFHIWVRYDKKRINEAGATRLGWFTMNWSRRMMMDMLLDALNNGWLDINSPWFIDEMADLEMEFENQKISAVGGAHDDRIMAAGIVLFSMHAMETRHADRWVTRERMERRNPNPTYMRFNPGIQGMEATEFSQQSGAGNTYTVVNRNDPSSDLLLAPGATIWTPDLESR